MPGEQTLNLTIRRVTETNDVAECFRIRKKVFVVEQGIPPDVEHDDQDRLALHFLARLGVHPVGAARVLLRGDGSARIGRIAVVQESRGLGIGRAILAAIEEAPELKSINTFVLHAQLYAVPFYEGLGYEAYGDAFISEAGKDAQHMKKTR